MFFARNAVKHQQHYFDKTALLNAPVDRLCPAGELAQQFCWSEEELHSQFDAVLIAAEAAGWRAVVFVAQA